MDVCTGGVPTWHEVEMGLRELPTRLEGAANEPKAFAGRRLEGVTASRECPLGRRLFRKHDVVEECA